VTTAVTSDHEVPMFLRSAGNDIFAIHTRAVDDRRRGEGIVLLQGGNWVTSIGRNRMWVDMARELAADGYDVIRFDYRGVGESGGMTKLYRLDSPFVDDVAAAAGALRAAGCERLVLVGTCFGARAALAAARIEGVAAVALFSTPIFDREMERLATRSVGTLARRKLRIRSLRSFVDPKRWSLLTRIVKKKARQAVRRVRGGSGAPTDDVDVSPQFLKQIQAAVDGGVRVLLAYGNADEYWRDFVRTREGRLGRILDRAGPQVEVREMPGFLHGLHTAAAQDAVLAELARWSVSAS
jgi:pimeloyl-ACP methyl ester carboxylesterase